jgi:hypothetical protein
MTNSTSSERLGDLQGQPTNEATTAVVSAVVPVPSDSPGGERQVLLSDKQQLALEWLLTTNGSVTEAAEFAGVTRATVSRWLNTDYARPAFISA